MSSRTGKIILGQRRAAQRQLRADVLAQRAAFAAFPRLELAAGEQLRSACYVPAGLIVKRAKLDAQIVALPDELRIFFQFAQAPFRFFAQPFPKLVALVKQARVRRIGVERLVVSGPRLCRFFAKC